MLSSSRGIRPLKESALRDFIKRALDRGWVRETFHSDVERAERNISHDDIRFGLEADWTLLEIREPSERYHKGFSYKLKTIDLEDCELILVVCPDLQSHTLRVATKF